MIKVNAFSTSHMSIEAKISSKLSNKQFEYDFLSLFKAHSNHLKQSHKQFFLLMSD